MDDRQKGDQQEGLVEPELDAMRSALVDTEKAIRSLLRRFSRVRRKAKDHLGLLDRPRLDMYIGMGTPERVLIRGRALEDPPLRPPQVEDSTWDNFRRSFRLLESDELPELEVEVVVGGVKTRCQTGEEGFFSVDVDLPAPLQAGWNVATAQPLGRHFSEPVEGRLLVPAQGARFGVISDIDDTILQTHVRNLPKMVWVTLLGNALTRLSFDGAPRLYQGIRIAGGDAPFFYVSRSAWNIHYLLEHFISHQGFPEGPMALRDAGLITPPPESRGSKGKEAQKIFDRFSPLPFILIGDSGQRDAQIYADLSRRYPGRVTAILIRNVTRARRTSRARRLLEAHSSCPYLIFDRDEEAIGWLESLGLWRVPEEKPLTSISERPG